METLSWGRSIDPLVKVAVINEENKYDEADGLKRGLLVERIRSSDLSLFGRKEMAILKKGEWRFVDIAISPPTRTQGRPKARARERWSQETKRSSPLLPSPTNLLLIYRKRGGKSDSRPDFFFPQPQKK